LMIVYGEDVADTGFTAADLSEQGEAFGRWPDIEKNLIKRAAERISLQQPAQQP